MGNALSKSVYSDSKCEASRDSTFQSLRGKWVAVVVFSHYPNDPRPRRAAEALVEHEANVDVICLKQSEDELSKETFNGVNIRRIPLMRQRGGKLAYLAQYSLFIIASFILLALRSLHRRYDLVHVHNMPDVLVFSALVPKAFGAKVILDIHDPMPELMMTIYGLGGKSRGVRLLKLAEKWSLRFADLVLTVNLACKKLISNRSCSAEKVCVVMNSPDEKIFKYRLPTPRSSSPRDAGKPFIVMYHGSLVERHGLDIAVRALGIIRQSTPGVELRIYGQSTPFLREVMASIEESNLRSAIHYLGPKNLEEIVTAIDECDVGIIPNRRSIFTEINTPTRIFEYLSRGKPVIAPLSAGIEDYFNHNQLVYFELGDANDLARSLQYVLSYPEEVEQIVMRGQEVYLKHKWSHDRIKFLKLVSHILSPIPGNAPLVEV
jgi:glycosyltransferase involved in cell wall biosynthesis